MGCECCDAAPAPGHSAGGLGGGRGPKEEAGATACAGFRAAFLRFPAAAVALDLTAGDAAPFPARACPCSSRFQFTSGTPALLCCYVSQASVDAFSFSLDIKPDTSLRITTTLGNVQVRGVGSPHASTACRVWRGPRRLAAHHRHAGDVGARERGRCTRASTRVTRGLSNMSLTSPVAPGPGLHAARGAPLPPGLRAARGQHQLAGGQAARGGSMRAWAPPGEKQQALQ